MFHIREEKEEATKEGLDFLIHYRKKLKVTQKGTRYRDCKMEEQQKDKSPNLRHRNDN